jgi:acetyl-CoA carboxylase carboxyltransferase component
MSAEERLLAREAKVMEGGAPKYHEQAAKQKKLFVRERIRLLVDPDSFVEDGLFANTAAPDLPADGVVTGLARIGGRVVAIMANDSTVKAGSWGARTVEKILRIQEQAERLMVPLFYLVDSAGARITDQVEMFPGRRHAGRIFFNEVRLSGLIPQICLLFGPSAAGGAYIPAFCDAVFMVEGNSSMYLGSPRMAEMVIGEKVTLEEMGGARMHCTVSGCGDILCASEEEAIALAKRYITYFPQHSGESSALTEALAPVEGRPMEQIVPTNQNAAFQMYELIDQMVDAGSFFEIKRLFAPEIITGFARMGGRTVGVVANQSRVKGGVLFVDSADKATRFVSLCDAFSIPLLFLSDVPGFMIGTAVERQGIIRHGAKMIAAISEATVPKICVVVRKAYGAGLYAMAGPAFEPDCTLALPTASIAVMGPEAAVNAVFANKIALQPEEERAAYVAELREAYKADIDIYRLASELIVDAVVPFGRIRQELVDRFALYASKRVSRPMKKHGVTPV